MQAQFLPKVFSESSREFRRGAIALSYLPESHHSSRRRRGWSRNTSGHNGLAACKKRTCARAGATTDHAPTTSRAATHQVSHTELLLVDLTMIVSTTPDQAGGGSLHQQLNRGTSLLLLQLLLLIHIGKKILMKMFNAIPFIDHAFSPCPYSHHRYPSLLMFLCFVGTRCKINCQMTTTSCLTNAQRHGSLHLTGTSDNDQLLVLYHNSTFCVTVHNWFQYS